MTSSSLAAGCSNTDFISTKMNVVNCPDVQTLHPMPSAGGSAQLNTNVSNIENKAHHSEQAGLSLQTRYNSTVRVNPNYPHAVALINWAKENKTMLLSSPSEKTSASSSIAPMIVTHAGQQLISIAEISSAPSISHT